ncbi:PH domain-containing protein [Actinoallomurus sp. CA-142502]|uniref:PH domain-containing protein n=1 Tax=Actinoallomurus sp. CA-142502 TaxID=3239885 RepID=UPI003D94DBBA
MNELSFRGKDRYRLSSLHFGGVGLLLVVEGVFAFIRLGPVGFCCLLGGTAALVGLGIFLSRRSWTTVGAAGVTISWGVGRGRTYSWQEIRWVDVRETKTQYGTSRSARITLANGRRRSLPALQHSTQYPDPDFDVDFRQVVDWWKSNTDPDARFEPPKRWWNRLTPQAFGFILGLLITIVVIVVVGIAMG